ncbi:MAG TPA: hypothetical protein VLU46_06095 [Thermoanaerobaculia bacterium]|nr:hypothetical protein [Thermoanaerobaculia bacterium]
MRKTTFIIALVGALLVPLAAFGQSVYSDTYVIPVAGHTQGLNGTWQTDVAITNFSSTPLTVQIIVVETGEGNVDNIFPLTTDTNTTGSVTVAPNTTVLLRDLLSTYRGRQSTLGALILGGDKPFAVTSRAYNTNSSSCGGSSLGQTVTPARDFFENSTGRSDNSAVAYLPGLMNNASTRTNIGFLAGTGSAAGQTMVVTVTIKNGAGQTLGTKLVTIPAGNFTQTQFSVSSVTSTPFDIGSAEIRITQGSGAVVPYASVIDNASGAAAYVMGQFPPSTPFSSGSTFTNNIFRALINAMSSRSNQ